MLKCGFLTRCTEPDLITSDVCECLMMKVRLCIVLSGAILAQIGLDGQMLYDIFTLQKKCRTFLSPGSQL